MDEACQATEVSTLIPLLLNPQKCVLIGDPKQLPATVISANNQNNYNLSLFERLTSNHHYAYLLNTQYRYPLARSSLLPSCHPNIIAFPNQCFYDGQLRNGENVAGRAYSHPFYESDYFYVALLLSIARSPSSSTISAAPMWPRRKTRSLGRTATRPKFASFSTSTPRFSSFIPQPPRSPS